MLPYFFIVDFLAGVLVVDDCVCNLLALLLLQLGSGHPLLDPSSDAS